MVTRGLIIPFINIDFSSRTGTNDKKTVLCLLFLYIITVTF